MVKAIRQLLPNAVFEAVGGPRLEAAGAEPRFPMERLSHMGFGSVLASLPLHYRLFQSLRDDLIAGRYDLAILVDYPGLVPGSPGRAGGRGSSSLLHRTAALGLAT